jgi:hypothetical protein
MGFFDFLSTPKQDIPTLEREQADLRKKKPQQEANPFQDDEALRVSQYKNEEARAGEASTLEGASNVNKSAGMAQKGLVQDYDRAVGDAFAALSNVRGRAFGKSDAFPSDERRRAVGEAVQVEKNLSKKANPLALADDFERLSSNKEFDPEERKAFSGVAAMFRRASQSRDAAAISGEMPKAAPPQEAIQQAKDKAENLRRQEEAARKQLETMGVTNPNRAGTQNAILEIAKERESVESSLKEFSPKAPVEVAPGPNDKLQKGFSSAGVSQKEVARSVNEGLEAVAGSMGADFNPGDAVSFQYALPYAIAALGPEAQLAFSEWMRDIKKKEAEAKGFTPTGNPAQDAGGMSAKGEGEGPSHQDMIRQNFEQQKLARADFAAAQELQSWPAIIAFCLLGMLIGPQGAFAFFSNARKKKELQGWLQQLEMERKYLSDEQDYTRKMESETRSAAARRLQHKEDRDETFRRQVGLTMLNHKLIIERNEKKGNPETAVMKKLQASYQRAIGMAAKYSGEMQNEFAPEDKRNSARANFNFYMKKAAALDMQLDEMGGDVLEEEPVEE